MSDREKFLEQKTSYLEPEETELEGRGKKLEINAPVTGAVTIPEAVVAGFGDGTVRFFRSDETPKIIDAHNGVVLCIATNGSEVFTGGDDGRFLQISPDGTIKEIASFGTRWVDNVAATKDNMVCSSGKNAYLWSSGNTKEKILEHTSTIGCLLYTSPSPRDATLSRMPSSA